MQLWNELDMARSEFERAWGELVPHPGRLTGMKARIALQAGDPVAARSLAEQGLALQPDSEYPARTALMVYEVLRDKVEAAAVYSAHQQFLEEQVPLLTARILAMLGDNARVEPLLAEVERRLQEDLPRPSPIHESLTRAQVALLRGDTEAGLTHLERAYGLGWLSYRTLTVQPRWDPLRDDPRFQALEARIDEDLARIRAELAAMEVES